MGGVAVRVVGVGGVRRPVAAGAGVGEGGDPVVCHVEGEVVLRRGSRRPVAPERRDVPVAVVGDALLGEGVTLLARAMYYQIKFLYSFKHPITSDL